MRHMYLLIGVLCGCSGGTASVPSTAIDGDADSDTDSDADSDTDSDTKPGDCTSHLARYDLTGSKFFIESLVDFTITVQAPYDEDTNTGPAHVVVRYPDVGGAPGEGAATLVDYRFMWDFVTGVGGFASVHTALDNTATDPCGIAVGTLASNTLTFSPAEMVVCQDGQISCTGAFCGTSGSPPEGQPEVVEAECSPMDLLPFTFTPDKSGFTMDAVTISDDGDTRTAQNFVGTLVSVEMDPNTPACYCGG